MIENRPVDSNISDDRTRRWPTKLIASFLLLVMLCTVAATPIAVLYRVYRQQNQEQAVVREEDTAIGGVNRIAFITGDQQLATISPGGGNRRLLTDNSRSYQFPAWSPDGTRLAVLGDDSLYVFIDREDAKGSGAYEVLYQDRDEPPFYLYWAPDSGEVSFLANHPDGIALHLANVDPNPESRLLAIGQPFYWDWDPTADKMLIHSGLSGEDARLAFLRSEQPEVEDNIADPGLFQAPGFAYDGQYWAYMERGLDGSGHLTIQNANGQTNTLDQHRGLVALSWSPVEYRLAYISTQGDLPAFYGPMRLLDALSGESRTLVNEPVIAYFWSPDGQSIAYFTLQDLDDESVHVDSERPKDQVLSKPARQERRLRLELWVVDINSERSRWLATFEPSRVFINQFLPFFDQYALSHRLWSPASDSLVIPIRDGDVSRIFVVPVDGGEPRPIADGTIGFWSHQ